MSMTAISGTRESTWGRLAQQAYAGSTGINYFDPTVGGGSDPFTGSSGGGINVGPGGVSGCINVPYVGQVCGEIPFGGDTGGGSSPPGEYPPSAPMPTNFDANCPDGYVRVLGQCVAKNPGAYLPGGQPATVPYTNGAVPKVPSQSMVTPILWANQYGKPSGHRLNKTGFYRKDPLQGGKVVWVAPKTAWVKSRRRNPMNARANSRAISRLSSAKKAAKALGRVTIRKKSC